MKVVVGFAFPRTDGLATAGAGMHVVRFVDPAFSEAMGRYEFETALEIGLGARAVYSFGKIVEPPSCFTLSPRLREDLALMHLLGLVEHLPVGTIVRPRLPPVPDGSVAELPPHVLAWTVAIVGPN